MLTAEIYRVFLPYMFSRCPDRILETALKNRAVAMVNFVGNYGPGAPQGLRPVVRQKVN